MGGRALRRRGRGDEPRDRRAARPGRPGRPRGRAPRDRRRQGGVPRLGARDGVRARRRAAPRRRRLRAPPRRARPRAHARPGQAAARRGLRRGRRARRDVARRRRGRHPPRGRDPAEHERRAIASCSSAARSARSRSSRRGTGRTRCRPRSSRPALACGNTVVWTPAPSTAVCSGLLAECVAEADLPPGRVQLRHRPRARWSATRSSATRTSPASASSARPRPACTSPRRAAGKALLLEMGGNGPLVVMDDADVDAAAEAAVMACFLCAGQSCTAGELLLVHEARARRLRRARSPSASRATSSSATRSRRARRWARSTTSRSRRRWTSTSRDAERARRERRHGRRAGRRLPDRALLAGDDPRRRPRRRAGRDRGDVRPDRAGRRRSASVEEAIEHHQPRRATGCCRRSSRSDLAQGLRFADEVRTGLVNINETTNYWENHLPVRRPRGDGQRDRARRRALPDGHAHRAADGRRQRLNASRISVSNAWTCSRIRAPARRRVAGDERGEERALLVDRGRERGDAVEDEVPDAQGERPQALERVEEVRVAGRLPDEVVDALVEAHVGVDPERALDRDELGVEPSRRSRGGRRSCARPPAAPPAARAPRAPRRCGRCRSPRRR